jgi:hypothetical protein
MVADVKKVCNCGGDKYNITVAAPKLYFHVCARWSEDIILKFRNGQGK